MGMKTDELVLGKDSGKGIKVDEGDPTFGWRDIEGLIRPDPAGANSPSLSTFKGGIRQYLYGANDKIDMVFHIPHDLVLGSDLFLHLHWSHNGTNISGSLVVDYEATYGDRDGVFGANILPTQTISGLTIGNTPQYVQRVDEIQLTDPSPAATQFDSDDINVDGIILVTLTVDTLPTITAGDLFVNTLDLHYQSTNIGTKNSSAPFYGA